jgi:glycosyltransferase involved in cell wall biosynthesis
MNRQDAPLVSVCIPAFNNEAFIGTAIESVLNQTFADFELVVVDDRSIDGTREKIRAFHDPRIRIVDNDRNLGHEGNWNKALREARGRFVKILPGDDLLLPRCLERQVAAFGKSEAAGVAIVACVREIIDETGRKIMRRGFPSAGGPISGIEAVRRCVRAGTNLIGEPAAVLMPAETAARAGAFDGANLYVIDLDFWARLLLQGNLFVIDEPLCAFRISRTAVSTRIRSSQSRDFRRWIEGLGRDPRFGLTRGDLRRGRAMAAMNEALRRMMYGLLLSRRRRK